MLNRDTPKNKIPALILRYIKVIQLIKYQIDIASKAHAEMYDILNQSICNLATLFCIHKPAFAALHDEDKLKIGLIIELLFTDPNWVRSTDKFDMLNTENLQDLFKATKVLTQDVCLVDELSLNNLEVAELVAALAKKRPTNNPYSLFSKKIKQAAIWGIPAGTIVYSLYNGGFLTAASTVAIGSFVGFLVVGSALAVKECYEPKTQPNSL